MRPYSLSCVPKSFLEAQDRLEPSKLAALRGRVRLLAPLCLAHAQGPGPALAGCVLSLKSVWTSLPATQVQGVVAWPVAIQTETEPGPCH